MCIVDWAFNGIMLICLTKRTDLRCQGGMNWSPAIMQISHRFSHAGSLEQGCSGVFWGRLVNFSYYICVTSLRGYVQLGLAWIPEIIFILSLNNIECAYFDWAALILRIGIDDSIREGRFSAIFLDASEASTTRLAVKWLRILKKICSFSLQLLGNSRFYTGRKRLGCRNLFP